VLVLVLSVAMLGVRVRPASLGVRDAFRYRVLDSMYRDPATWDGYDAPGFSCAVIVQAVREAGRQDGVPTPGGFIASCIRHREQFRQWNADTEKLLELRYEAEDYLEAHQPQRLALTYAGSAVDEDDDDWDVPF
jgi:hypothetical protein